MVSPGSPFFGGTVPDYGDPTRGANAEELARLLSRKTRAHSFRNGWPISISPGPPPHFDQRTIRADERGERHWPFSTQRGYPDQTQSLLAWQDSGQ
jgi:hypothetical protein